MDNPLLQSIRYGRYDGALYPSQSAEFMSIGAVYPERYQAQLDDKRDQLDALLAPFAAPPLQVFPSCPEQFRMRAEFHVWHDGDALEYVMFDQATRQPIPLTGYPMGSAAINALMMPLLEAIQPVQVLRHKLFQIEFLTATHGETLVSLLYHKRLDEHWEAAARTLKAQFGIQLVGRARKQKIVLDQPFITETLEIDGRTFSYRQVENSFTQPNAHVCTQMLTWALGCARDYCSGDLIELYCGNGNFTAVLATHFDKVLATEISKTSVAAAEHNFAANGIDNVQIARLSAEEFTQALNRERPFRRLAHVDLDRYRLNTIFVDPPRAGLDPETEKLVQRFDRIIYISCNPKTLAQNLERLSQTHRIERSALFDQFPYTPHIEAGVMLCKR